MRFVLRDSTALLTAMAFTFVSLTTGCKSGSSSSQSVPTQNTSQGVAQNSSAQQMNLDDLVAPIALYPDQLLAQVLSTAANPQEVLDLGNWLLQNQNLQGDAATNAAKQAGFSPSAQYLAMFPQVVDNMCQQMDWTRELGEAFKTDQAGVMQAVQLKRLQAQQIGNLNSSPQMTVANKTADNGQKYVEIQPADPKTVYVPQYNPVTIYNTQAPGAAPAPETTTTTTTTTSSGVSTGAAVAIGLLSFGVGMAVGSAINNNNYYPYPAWGYHSIYVVNRPYYPPLYRPPVYPGYRPVYGYNPPANYHWNQYNRNVNVNVNNNYYNRFNNRTANTLPAYKRPGADGGGVENPRLAQNNNWRGQTTYQGARSNAVQGQKPGASMANAIPRNEQYGYRGNNQMASNRQNTGNLGTTQMAANRSSFNNSAGGNRGNASGTNLGSRPAAEPNMNRGGDRGYASNASSPRPTPSASAAARPAPQSNPALQNRSSSGGGGGAGAFGGGRSESGASERAASNRGRASVGSGGGGGRRRR